MEDSKKYIYDQNLENIQTFFQSMNEPAYRAAQLWQGLYKHYWNLPEQFSNFPQSLRTSLENHFSFSRLIPEKTIHSADLLTQKTLFLTPDGYPVETVLMKYNARNTLCISSQSGCAMGCVFCATGQMGFKKNLSAGEIIEQVIQFSSFLKEKGESLSNIVVMGMGEPFHNYQATLDAIDCLNDPQGMNFGARRFTISTVGIVPAIKKFAEEKKQINLAISLHASSNELRSSLLPINKKYPIEELLEACREYVKITRRRITFEWALIDGINDDMQEAQRLSTLIRGLLCHVNIIPLNPTTKYSGKPTSQEKAALFKEELQKNGIPCTIRLRRGIEIAAGCGQLAGNSSIRYSE